LLDGADVTDEIRTPEISLWVGPVSEHPLVRKYLVDWQRELGKGGGVVLEGRDIGTVVFPDADLKIYMIADLEARALRRKKEMAARGIDQQIREVEAALGTRDVRDSTREHSPLKKAEDAVEMDTTHLTIGDQVDAVVRLAKKIGVTAG
jgi:cytidylate kinase